VSIGEPFHPHIELDVLYGPFSYPNRLGAYRQETRIDWQRVIRVRRKDRSTPYDLCFTELWRSPEYVQPVHLLTDEGLWQPVLGTVTSAELEDACYYAVVCGVSRILDARGLDTSGLCAEMTQRFDPAHWQATVRAWQERSGATWLEPSEQLLSMNEEFSFHPRRRDNLVAS